MRTFWNGDQRLSFPFFLGKVFLGLFISNDNFQGRLVWLGMLIKGIV